MRTLLLALLLSASISLRAQQFTFTTIDPPNGTNTTAERVNSNGVIVGYTVINSVVSGFIFDGNAYQIINYPGASGTYLFGINSSNETTGFYYDSASVTHAFLRSSDGTFSAVTLPVPVSYVQPEQVNDNGQLVGYFGDTNNPVMEHGFLLDGTSFQQIDYPGAAVTATLDINNSGQMVGQEWTTTNGPFNGYTFSNGVYNQISAPKATFTEADGLNNVGQFVGSLTRGGPFHGFVRRNGSGTTFDVPGSTGTRAFSINDSGVIVGYFTDSRGISHGFMAQPVTSPSPKP